MLKRRNLKQTEGQKCSSLNINNTATFKAVMNKVSVQSLNECFNVSGEDFIWIDENDYEQPKINQPWNKGKKGLYKHSEQSKKMITGRPPGFVVSEETKAIWSEQRRGENNNFYGKKHTEEANRKITARHRKHYRFISPEGKVFEDFTTIREFCRKIKICPKTLKAKWLVEELTTLS